jgi:Pyridoxamine 5'-phosphate oxidase
MSTKLLPARILRAKELLRTAKHACIATVNEDGTPHASPLYLILDETLSHIYFCSYPESLHTKNVARTGDMFIAVYDMIEEGGLYLQAINGKELHGEGLEAGLTAHNATRVRRGKELLTELRYKGRNPQRMYGADITHFWVNMAEKDKDGNITKEYRHEITAADLL